MSVSESRPRAHGAVPLRDDIDAAAAAGDDDDDVAVDDDYNYNYNYNCKDDVENDDVLLTDRL